MRRLLLPIACCCALAISACGSGGGSTTTSTSPSTQASVPSTTTTPTTVPADPTSTSAATLPVVSGPGFGFTLPGGPWNDQSASTAKAVESGTGGRIDAGTQGFLREDREVGVSVLRVPVPGDEPLSDALDGARATAEREGATVGRTGTTTLAGEPAQTISYTSTEGRKATLVFTKHDGVLYNVSAIVQPSASTTPASILERIRSSWRWQ